MTLQNVVDTMAPYWSQSEQDELLQLLAQHPDHARAHARYKTLVADELTSKLGYLFKHFEQHNHFYLT